MIVMMMASTPSLNASSRDFFMRRAARRRSGQGQRQARALRLPLRARLAPDVDGKVGVGRRQSRRAQQGGPEAPGDRLGVRRFPARWCGSPRSSPARRRPNRSRRSIPRWRSRAPTIRGVSPNPLRCPASLRDTTGPRRPTHAPLVFSSTENMPNPTSDHDPVIIAMRPPHHGAGLHAADVIRRLWIGHEIRPAVELAQAWLAQNQALGFQLHVWVVHRSAW